MNLIKFGKFPRALFNALLRFSLNSEHEEIANFFLCNTTSGSVCNARCNFKSFWYLGLQFCAHIAARLFSLRIFIRQAYWIIIASVVYRDD